MRVWVLVAVIAAGLLSRMVHSGWIVVDKYLGDALYAVMVYLLLPGRRRALWAMAVMTGIEVFQLTGIPARMVKEGGGVMWAVGRLLGTTFGWGDLAAYAVGIWTAAAVERGRIFRSGKRG